MEKSKNQIRNEPNISKIEQKRKVLLTQRNMGRSFVFLCKSDSSQNSQPELQIVLHQSTSISVTVIVLQPMKRKISIILFFSFLSSQFACSQFLF